MRNNSGYNRGRKFQPKVVEKPKTFEPKNKPPQLDEILGKKPIEDIAGLYLINPKTNTLEPKFVPKNRGNLVLVEKGLCPKGQENNVICDHLEFFDTFEYKVWVPYFKFYIGQFVTFWTKQTEYVFQIFPNDDSRLGEFKLIEKRAVVRQPGQEYRTSKSKSV